MAGGDFDNMDEGSDGNRCHGTMTLNVRELGEFRASDVPYLDSVEGGHTEGSEREEDQNRNVHKQIGSAVQTLEWLSQLTKNVLSGNNDLK